MTSLMWLVAMCFPLSGQRSPSILLLPAGSGLIHYLGRGAAGTANQRLKLTGAAILVFRASTFHRRPRQLSRTFAGFGFVGFSVPRHRVSRTRRTLMGVRIVVAD